MKHIALFLLCALGISGAAVAQDNEYTGPMWGVKAAFDINIPGKYHFDDGSLKMFDHSYGFTVGVVNNIYLGRNFYLEPGVSFFYDSYKLSETTIISGDGTTAAVSRPSAYKLGVRIPLVVGYSLNLNDRLGLSFYTGPELSVTCADKGKGKTAAGREETFDFLESTYQRRADLAWKIGVGVPYENFLIGIDAAIGVTDLHKGPAVSYRENRVSVGLTYYF
ncbi:MAG: porin family protein [Bacteroidales bacterium]|nr:porin family protein [Bacteroidales bacterium]